MFIVPLTAALLWETHRVVQQFRGIDVIWRDDECYVFIGVANNGWSGSYLSFIWGSVKSAVLGWAAASSASIRREDTIVVHYLHGELRRIDLDGFLFTGAMVPINGSLYAFRGGNAPLPVWRWTGSDLERLSLVEAEQIRGRFQYKSDQISIDGWSQLDYRVGFPKKPIDELNIGVDGGSLVVQVDSFGRHGLGKVIEVRAHGEKATVIVNTDPHSVDKATYQRMLNETHRPRWELPREEE